jgi:hypothetical protein
VDRTQPIDGRRAVHPRRRAHRAIPFETAGARARAVVGRISVRLEERFEDLDGTPVQPHDGPGRRIVPAPARVP